MNLESYVPQHKPVSATLTPNQFPRPDFKFYPFLVLFISSLSAKGACLLELIAIPSKLKFSFGSNISRYFDDTETQKPYQWTPTD